MSLIKSKIRLIPKESLAYKIYKENLGTFSKMLYINNKNGWFSLKFRKAKYLVDKQEEHPAFKKRLPIWLVYRGDKTFLSTNPYGSAWLPPARSGSLVNYIKDYELPIDEILNPGYKDKELRRFVLYNINYFIRSE